jgi:hypothetical protein
MVRFWLALIVSVPFEVRPEVAVMRPEIVGVAVQAVGFTVSVVPDFPKDVPVEFVIPSCSAPAESITVLPDVAVVIVRFPDVFVQLEAPPEATVKTPVELPMFVAAVPVALIFVVPVIVKPPVPCINPEPAVTPTEVINPAIVSAPEEVILFEEEKN